MAIEEDLLYTKEHEWVDIQENTAVIGISHYAQEQLGDITYIELPKVGDEVEQFGELATIESVKAASDIFAPMSGKIIEINADLESEPGIINKSPYENGWIVKIEITDVSETENLLNAQQYNKFLESSG